MVTLDEAMRELESRGSEENQANFLRQGVRTNTFGVGSADQAKLARKIGTDHDLAEQLWATGNHDACVLATRIADPSRTDWELIDRWRTSLDSRLLTDAVAALASRAILPRNVIDDWSASKDDWTGQLAWTLVGASTMESAISDEYFRSKLETIEQQIHGRPNATRYAMNGALMAIGTRNASLSEAALAAAQRMGKVEVDFGDGRATDAAAYIAAWAKPKNKPVAKFKKAVRPKKTKPAKASKSSPTKAAKKKPKSPKKKKPAKAVKKRPAKASKKKPAAKKKSPPRGKKAAAKKKKLPRGKKPAPRPKKSKAGRKKKR